jgi:hypothetical protein
MLDGLIRIQCFLDVAFSVIVLFLLVPFATAPFYIITLCVTALFVMRVAGLSAIRWEFYRWSIAFLVVLVASIAFTSAMVSQATYRSVIPDVYIQALIFLIGMYG